MNAGLATAAPQLPPGPQPSVAPGATPAPTRSAGEGFGAHLAKAIAIKAPSKTPEEVKPAAQSPEARAPESRIERPTRATKADRADTVTEKADPAPSKDEPVAQNAAASGVDANTQTVALAASQVHAPPEPGQAVPAPTETVGAANDDKAGPSDLTGFEPADLTGFGSDAVSASLSPDITAPDLVTSATTAEALDTSGFAAQAAQVEATPRKADAAAPSTSTDQAKLAQQILAEQVQAEQAQSALPQSSLDQSGLAVAEQTASATRANDTGPSTAKSETTSPEAKPAKGEAGVQMAETAGTPVAVLATAGRSGGGFSGDANDTAGGSDTASTLASSSDAAGAAKPPPAPVDANQVPIPAPIHVAPQTLQTAAVVMKAGPQTVSTLAAQIVSKVEGGATRFDLELHPLDLGRVDVRLEVGAGGQISASMAFDNPQAAAEMRARSADLQKALETAGFNLSGGLSFDVAGDRGQGGSRNTAGDQGLAQRARALETATSAAAEVADAASLMSAYGARPARGVDIRI